MESRLRALLEVLSGHTHLTVISPASFTFPYGRLKAEFSGAEPYGVRLYPCVFPLGVKTSTRWILSSRDLDFQTLRPDIVHVENEPHSLAVLQAVWAARTVVPRPRLIVSSWGNRWPPQPKATILRGILRTVQSRIDLFISANTAGKILLERDGVDSRRIEVFPSTAVHMTYYRPLGAKAREDHRAMLGLPTNAFVVGYSGRFVPEKGLPDLLAAVDLARSRVEREVVVLCVGDGPLKPMLTNTKGVRVASPGADGRVLPYYQAMDAFVLASKATPHWEEQFGRSLVEAMACGVPVIGSKSGAIPEVVADAGLLFGEGRVDELAARLGTLIIDSGVRQRCAASGVDRVRERYSVEAIAKKTLASYDKVLGQAR